MALRWKAFAPNTILRSVEVQDLADNGVVQLDTAADLASADLVNANVTYVVNEAKPYVRSAPGVGADKWQVFSGGLAGLGGWAEITATTGSPTKHEYTDGDGNDWTAYEFTGDGSVTASEGLVDVLVVSAASKSVTRNDQGGHGGGVIRGVTQLGAGTHAVQIGTSGVHGSGGGPSIFNGIYPTGGLWNDSGWILGPTVTLTSSGLGGFTPAPGDGLMDDITGVSIGYGGGANADPKYGGGNPPRANSGGGRTLGIDGPGASGCVIIRVPKSKAKV